MVILIGEYTYTHTPLAKHTHTHTHVFTLTPHSHFSPFPLMVSHFHHNHHCLQFVALLQQPPLPQKRAWADVKVDFLSFCTLG